MSYQQTIKPNLSKNDADDWLKTSRKEFLSFLKTLVEINTFSKNPIGINQAQAIIKKELEACGLSVTLKCLPGEGNHLIAQTALAGSNDIILSGHIDTVHELDSDFKSFSCDDVFAYGPGVLDMKCGVSMIVWLIKALHRENLLKDLPLTVIISSDEELGAPYSRELIKEHSTHAQAALVFEWGRDNDGLIVQRRGMKMYSLTSRGISAHAGNAHQSGVNAITSIAHAVLELEKLTQYEKNITCNIGHIQGGSAVNVIPDLAVLQFEVRAPSVNDFVDIDNFITALVKELSKNGAILEVELRSEIPPMEVSKKSLALAESIASHSKAYELSFHAIDTPLGGASNANDFASFGVATIDGLGPTGMHAHSAKEYIELASIEPRLRAVFSWLKAQAL